MQKKALLFRHLFLPCLGFAMLLGTLIWGAAMGNFPIWLLGMGVSAIALVILGVLWQEGGSLRDTVTSLTYSLFVFLSVIFIYLFLANHSTRIDLTRFQVNTLSEQSIGLIQNLDSQIRVTAFAVPQDHADLRDFFDLYDQYSDNITFEIYDPEADIAVARGFEENVYPGYTYVAAYRDGEEIRRNRLLFSLTDARRENKLSNSILQAERGKSERIYFTSGHNERALEIPEDDDPARQVGGTLSLFAQILRQNVMPVSRINLMTESRVPEDAALVIIASPSADLLELERETLIAYINEGGSILVFLEPEFGQGELNDLQQLINYAGIESPNELLVDRFGSPSYLDVLSAPAGNHAILSNLEEGVVVTPQARPVNSSPDISDKSTVFVQPLLATNKAVWTEDPRRIFNTGKVSMPQDETAIHARTVGAVSSFPTPGSRRGESGRIVVYGDGDFVSDGYIANGAPAILALNTVNWLVQREDMLNIPPKLIPATSFQLPLGRLYLILGILILIGLLLLAGGVGFTVMRRRMG